ncbi:hypothetical protein BGX27_008692 [Mortierella sp. AM989]|nr:hypothetical protein BGX27_008692 [Mortierella sp. AM989]
MSANRTNQHPDDATMSTLPAQIEACTRDLLGELNQNVELFRGARHAANFLEGGRSPRLYRAHTPELLAASGQTTGELGAEVAQSHPPSLIVSHSVESDPLRVMLSPREQVPILVDPLHHCDIEDIVASEIVIVEEDGDSAGSSHGNPNGNGNANRDGISGSNGYINSSRNPGSTAIMSEMWYGQAWRRIIVDPLRRHGVAAFIGFVPIFGPAICFYVSYKLIYEPVGRLKIGRTNRIALEKVVFSHIFQNFLLGMLIPILGPMFGSRLQMNHRAVNIICEKVRDHVQSSSVNYVSQVNEFKEQHRIQVSEILAQAFELSGQNQNLTQASGSSSGPSRPPIQPWSYIQSQRHEMTAALGQDSAPESSQQSYEMLPMGSSNCRDNLRGESKGNFDIELQLEKWLNEKTHDGEKINTLPLGYISAAEAIKIDYERKQEERQHALREQMRRDALETVGTGSSYGHVYGDQDYANGYPSSNQNNNMAQGIDASKRQGQALTRAQILGKGRALDYGQPSVLSEALGNNSGSNSQETWTPSTGITQPIFLRPIPHFMFESDEDTQQPESRGNASTLAAPANVPSRSTPDLSGQEVATAMPLAPLTNSQAQENSDVRHQRTASSASNYFPEPPTTLTASQRPGNRTVIPTNSEVRPVRPPLIRRNASRGNMFTPGSLLHARESNEAGGSSLPHAQGLQSSSRPERNSPMNLAGVRANRSRSYPQPQGQEQGPFMMTRSSRVVVVPHSGISPLYAAGAPIVTCEPSTPAPPYTLRGVSRIEFTNAGRGLLDSDGSSDEDKPQACGYVIDSSHELAMGVQAHGSRAASGSGRGGSIGSEDIERGQNVMPATPERRPLRVVNADILPEDSISSRSNSEGREIQNRVEGYADRWQSRRVRQQEPTFIAATNPLYDPPPYSPTRAQPSAPQAIYFALANGGESNSSQGHVIDTNIVMPGTSHHNSYGIQSSIVDWIEGAASSSHHYHEEDSPQLEEDNEDLNQPEPQAMGQNDDGQAVLQTSSWDNGITEGDSFYDGLLKALEEIKEGQEHYQEELDSDEPSISETNDVAEAFSMAYLYQNNPLALLNNLQNQSQQDHPSQMLRNTRAPIQRSALTQEERENLFRLLRRQDDLEEDN